MNDIEKNRSKKGKLRKLITLRINKKQDKYVQRKSEVEGKERSTIIRNCIDRCRKEDA